MKISATNKATGEVIEQEIKGLDDLIVAWRLAQEYEKTATALKNQLKDMVPSFVGERGISDEVNSFQFRVSNIQRYTYDKATMREVLDADVFDVLLQPDKTAVDKYLAENLEALGEGSTRLRNAMLPVGKPYQVIKLERVKRDE